MQLYADPITINCRKVMAGLKLMGIDDTLSKVDYFQAEQTSNAALPAMRDGDLTLWESNSILAYAADRHGKAAFYPTDPVARADVNRWLFWESAHWFPACYTYLVENCVKPLLGVLLIRRCWRRQIRCSTSTPRSWTSGWPSSPGCAATRPPSPTSQSRPPCTCTAGSNCPWTATVRCAPG